MSPHKQGLRTACAVYQTDDQVQIIRQNFSPQLFLNLGQCTD